MSQAAKILIGDEKISEQELENKFVRVFTTMCESGIPIWGFFNDDIGQWMYGPVDIFRKLFIKKCAVIEFNLENYVESIEGPFWFVELAPKPMDSKLIKYEK